MKRAIVLFIGLSLLGGISWALETKLANSQGITGDEAGSSEQGTSVPEMGNPPPPPQSTQSTQDKAKERLKTIITLSLTGADLRSVLSGLAKTYELNIVADEKIKGTVNISLKGVTLGEALDQILGLNGYTYIWEGSILKVVSKEEQLATEVLLLNFIQPDVALEFVKKEASESAVLKADEVQNGILVTDKISKIQAMKKILEKIDLAPQQVLIQARVLDITHTDLDNLGLKLSSVAFNIPTRIGSPLGSERILAFSSGTYDISGPSSDLTTHPLTFTVANGPTTTTWTVDALIRNKRVKVLASPSVATLNNVESKITIGEKFPIKETTQTTTGTLQTTRFVDIGITMRVTPKVTQNGFIQMKIHPEVSSVSSTIDAGPRITTREADLTIIVKDRESVVIAGLIKEDETSIRDRIPLLGHIPFFGLLFSNRSKTYEQKELVVVITPYLMALTPTGAKGSELEGVNDRLNATEVFRKAQDFEFGKTLQASSTPEPLRLLTAVDLYENLAKNYPNNFYAPWGLWRASEICLNRLQDPSRAKANLDWLLDRYPKHTLVASATRRIKEIDDYQARKQRNRNFSGQETKKAKGKAVSQAITPFGFR
ncbi:MAG: hypothetical protein HY211_04530 [Candidatus Omnitrophica bacterium]|nr:hypothetical protein [Candidatus Omnitrophota bacterium]